MSDIQTTEAEIEIKTIFDRLYVKSSLSECWNWEGRLQSGYGILWHKRIKWRAHRLAWLLSGKKLTSGLVLDHICRNRRCVNPSHLRETTIGENVLIGVGVTAQNKVKTHCKNGHPFDAKNTIIHNIKHGNPWRACRICKNASDREGKKRKRAKEAQRG